MYKNYDRLETQIMARIFCPHCKQPVAIRTSEQVTNTTREVYTNCNNETCLSRPVFTISHIRDAQPPISKLPDPLELATKYFESLSPQDRKTMLANCQL